MALGKNLLNEIKKTSSTAVTGVAGFTGLTWWVSSSVGIAVAGTAIPATIPFTVIGFIVAVLAVMAWRLLSSSR